LVFFVYYTIKLEEEKDIEYSGSFRLLKEHSKAILAFVFLFLGFILAFSFWYMVLPNGDHNFRAQIETFCQINRPDNFDLCIEEYGIHGFEITGAATSQERLLTIFSNNIYVLMFTIVFSISCICLLCATYSY